MKMQRLSGCGTALVTPFSQSGEIDERSLRAFVEWQITSGVHFIVPCGSTGEAATMTAAEHRRGGDVIAAQTRGRRVPARRAGGAIHNDRRAPVLRRKASGAAATA